MRPPRRSAAPPSAAGWPFATWGPPPGARPAPTREEYERLGEVKLQLLRKLGLGPDARVLDVGCGTGLLTAALERFLSARGLYYGTDLAPEAVRFCRERFRRPNFVFVPGVMTT